MNQRTFTDLEYSRRKQKNRREEFFETMDRIVPWDEYVDRIRPHYHSGKRGRKPKGIETMLRMYLMQEWFNMSASGIEDTVYDSYAMRSFLHIDFMESQVPDANTLLRFRHLLEDNGLDKEIAEDVQARLKDEGLILRCGMVTDAVLVNIPTAPKQRKKKARTEPEEVMGQLSLF